MPHALTYARMHNAQFLLASTKSCENERKKLNTRQDERGEWKAGQTLFAVGCSPAGKSRLAYNVRMSIQKVWETFLLVYAYS